mmetsp:Transcript_13284/g.23861  ORF Transcript_13284/g.23861 Transcript_13284/m.23861 type:complete len:114 (-) Transcript_13284:1984-2325(-)
MERKSTETIQTLLDAEKKAAEKVELARKERDALLKKAAAEAEAEIAAYRTLKDKEYKAEIEKYQGSSGDASVQIAADADKKIAVLQETAKKNREEVIRMLAGLVTSVDLTVKD